MVATRLPCASAPSSRADMARLMKAGVRDLRGAAKFLGKSRRYVQRLIQSRALWSTMEGGKRVVPIVELRRYLVDAACEAEGM